MERHKMCFFILFGDWQSTMFRIDLSHHRHEDTNSSFVGLLCEEVNLVFEASAGFDRL